MKINVSERRAQIREALLKLAPLGSRSAEVLALIQQRLLPKDSPAPPLLARPASGPSAEASDRRGVKSIQLDLGDYPNPGLLAISPTFPFEQSLQAQWAFDADDRLIELFLDRSLKQ